MDRRGFLKSMAQAVAAAAILNLDDPEKLLWEPGKKTIFLPDEPKIKVTGFLPKRDAAELWQVWEERVRRPITMPSRYVVTLAAPFDDIRGQYSVGFTSQWKPVGGFKDGKTLSQVDLERIAGQMFHGGNRGGGKRG